MRDVPCHQRLADAVRCVPAPLIFIAPSNLQAACGGTSSTAKRQRRSMAVRRSASCGSTLPLVGWGKVPGVFHSCAPTLLKMRGTLSPFLPLLPPPPTPT